MAITRKELIKKYIDFFKSKYHKEIPNVSLIPENDPTVLFTTAGMHPLVPFLLGEKHPQGKRLVNNQKCIRTGDMDEVGDTTHHTFFEMLGNWSLGDYWKKPAIQMSFEFLTKKLKIPKEKLAVTCFKGDKNAEKDTESAKIWENLGIPKKRIAFLKEDNWWGPAGKTGPCGPSTEIFYYQKENPPKNFNPDDKNWVEIGNDVLMQYNKDLAGFKEAKQKNIDFGGGVERTLAVLNKFDDNYLTEIWQPIIKQIEKLSKKKYTFKKGDLGYQKMSTCWAEDMRSMRIIADHIKASVFIMADGIQPSNTEQGYVLRRLIRRAIRYGKELGIESVVSIAEPVFKIYEDYKHLQKNKSTILEQLKQEEEKFEKALEEGLKVAEKIFKIKKPIEDKKYKKLMRLKNHQEILKNLWNKKRKGKDYSIKEANISKKEIDSATITGKEGFLLYQSYGFPAEMIIELSREKNLIFHRGEFRREEEKHQQLSRTATEGKFKSGLADDSEATTKLHTTTHLLNQALRQVLKDKNIQQKGSNITAERLRFDFNFPRKLTPEELKKVEDVVNKIIKQKLPIKKQEMTVEQAKKQGAQGIFETKYKEKVSVYSIGNFSKEICAGPHVKNTSELGKFKIKKEESSAAGIRRIKAVLK